jgi:hypothetical protein
VRRSGGGSRSPSPQIVAFEEARGLAAGVVVELVDEQDVRPDALDDLGDRVCLVVARPR